MDKLLNDFSAGNAFWMTVLFLGLIFLLKKFAWKPILDSVEDREEGIKKALLAAEEAKKEMQNLNADNEKLLKEARAERDAMLKEAREIKEEIISEAKEEAKIAAGKMIDNAKASIEQEKQAAITGLKEQVAEISINIAKTVVKKELASDKDQLQLVDQLLKDVTLN